MNLNLPMVIRPHVRVWLTRVITVKQIEIALTFLKVMVTFGLFIQIGMHSLINTYLLYIPYTQVNKRNWLRSAYCLLSVCFFPGFAPG